MTRRADPLESRARELALAAGVDPDSRVPKPGSERGMPAWCTFHDAAHAELNACEAREAAAEIVNLLSQQPKYRNSPVTVIGDHDAATIAQMRNCMSIGNAVAGAICADRHLGYAKPVGGVIAYGGQISISGGSVTDMVHSHHNYAWRETHNGVDLWVARKGATPAFPGQRGFVGGSMGDDAVILEGVDSETSRASLYSTIHGAGRLFGRKEAKRRFTRAAMDAWLRDRGVRLSGADLDESPMAYRRLPDVLAPSCRDGEGAAYAAAIRGGDGGRRGIRSMEGLTVDNPPPRPKRPPPGSKLAARQKREAAALRANLRKRKDQARAREKPKQE